MKTIKVIFVLIIYFFLQGCNTAEPPDEETEYIEPGSRNYTWTVDTLDVIGFGVSGWWGTSANSSWAVGSGASIKDCLWYYDGNNWERYTQRINSSLSSIHGVSPDEIWIGDSEKTIWKYDGIKWNKFQEFSVPGYDRIVISSVCGEESNNLYAVGFADNSDGSGYKGIILRYNGYEWKFLNIPNMKIGFYNIKQMDNGKYIVAGLNIDNGFLDKLFVFDGNKTLNEIYSDYYFPHLTEINGTVYADINSKIYKCSNNGLDFWKEFPELPYFGGIIGRSENDILGSGDNGIYHYNGTDLKLIYSTGYPSAGALIFEKDVFFYSIENNLNIIIHGKLNKE